MIGRAGMLLGCIALGACARTTIPPKWSGFGGDPGRGATVIASAGCGQCHVIPGIDNATGVVGPPLEKFGIHTTVAGLLSNTPDNLVRWIRFPQTVLPGNAMPDTRLTERQARDAAAYLHTLD